MPRFFAAAAVSASFVCFAASAQTSPPLTPAETTAGWKYLFDGSNTDAWRGYKQPAFPSQGWTIDGGALKVGKGGGDIITKVQYEDFELSLEFKCAPKANSGIIYRVAEKHDATWQTGPEFQVLDDANYGAKPDDAHACGALYDMDRPPADKPMKPAGEWNTARIRIKDGLLQHYLNGVKVVECRMDGPDWKAKIAASKFKEYEGFGLQPKGHIALQEHGDEVWFRNIRIRDLKAPMPNEMTLFNGKDFDGWNYYLENNGKMTDVWSVDNGVIVCKGKPTGYLRTKQRFISYVLKLEWRFSPVTRQAGNSGVLLRTQLPDKVWPKSIEAQLQSGSAGDFWCIDEYKMKGDAARTNGRNTKHLHANERPIGEWNEYEIIVNETNVTLNVNGDTLNTATECAVLPGFIGLQSEGAEIHFRNIRLSQIK